MYTKKKFAIDLDSTCTANESLEIHQASISANFTTTPFRCSNTSQYEICLLDQYDNKTN